METGLFTSEKLSGLLRFQVERKLVFLSKGFLELLEEFRDNQFISEDDFRGARKKILDRLGDSKREIEETFSKFKVELF